MTSPITRVEQATSNSSLWDRASSWVSENKAVAYTIAGTVVVITAGGVVYYLNDSQKKSSAATEKKKSKKERRKEKKEKEEAAAQGKPADGIKLQDEEAGRPAASSTTYTNTDARATAIGSKEPKPPTVEAEDDLPEIRQSTVDSFSQEVPRAPSAARPS